eukprot:snap_masked-scaffold_28-processed-gene-0.1-mRNA-1 protein AED:1.00 eAED:1.00 QI:0/-1/0/0/-1/1/1/0/67
MRVPIRQNSNDAFGLVQELSEESKSNFQPPTKRKSRAKENKEKSLNSTVFHRLYTTLTAQTKYFYSK